MATLAKFKVSAISQSEKQKQFGICTISLVAATAGSLFGKSSSPESLSLTRTAELADLTTQFPVGTEVEGYKTRVLIKKPWTNTNGVTVRHRLYLSNNEAESDKDEAAVQAEYDKFATAAPAPAVVANPAAVEANTLQTA